MIHVALTQKNKHAQYVALFIVASGINDPRIPPTTKFRKSVLQKYHMQTNNEYLQSMHQIRNLLPAFDRAKQLIAPSLLPEKA